MSLIGIVVAGMSATWLGADRDVLGPRIGRPLLMRYGRYVMITPEKIEQAETWSATFGTVGIFVSRLLPVIRHLIGIPAGIVRMDYLKFSAATVVGSALWRFGLRLVGVTMGQDQELMAGNLHRISMWVGGLMLFLGRSTTSSFTATCGGEPPLQGQSPGTRPWWLHRRPRHRLLPAQRVVYLRSGGRASTTRRSRCSRCP